MEALLTETCDGFDNDGDGLVDEDFDEDEDGIADCLDNCPGRYNPGQEDEDQDGLGDASAPPVRPPVAFVRGDVNADGREDLADAVFLLNYLFARGRVPKCLKTADSDDGGSLDIGDAIYVLNYIFAGGPEPRRPFGACGLDPTADGLTCRLYPPCEEAR